MPFLLRPAKKKRLVGNRGEEATVQKLLSLSINLHIYPQVGNCNRIFSSLLS